MQQLLKGAQVHAEPIRVTTLNLQFEKERRYGISQRYATGHLGKWIWRKTINNYMHACAAYCHEFLQLNKTCSLRALKEFNQQSYYISCYALVAQHAWISSKVGSLIETVRRVYFNNNNNWFITENHFSLQRNLGQHRTIFVVSAEYLIYALQKKVAQTRGKQYYWWSLWLVFHTDDNCKVSRSESGRE